MNVNVALLFFRVSFSLFIIILHGIPKLKNLFSGNIQFANILGMGETVSLVLATIAEVVFPILIIIGFKTRLATIPLIITMVVAAFVYHGADPISVQEKPLLFLCGFITILLAGAGKYSVDRK